MELALGRSATDNRAAFDSVAALLRECPRETAHYLLIRAYTAAGHVYANEAAVYLLETPEALTIGYGDVSDSSPLR